MGVKSGPIELISMNPKHQSGDDNKDDSQADGNHGVDYQQYTDYKKYLQYKEHTDYQKYVSKAGSGQHYQDIFQSFTDFKQFLDYQKFADYQHLKHSGDFSDYQKYIPEVVKSIIPASTDMNPAPSDMNSQGRRKAKNAQADGGIKTAVSDPILLASVDPTKRQDMNYH